VGCVWNRVCVGWAEMQGGVGVRDGQGMWVGEHVGRDGMGVWGEVGARGSCVD
jgi:hypothetical protein